MTLIDGATGVNVPSSNLHQTGSAKAIMPGLECVYTFNGCVMNDLSLLDKIRFTNIAGFDDATLRQGEDMIPGRDGSYPVDGLYGPRLMTFTGRIEPGDIRLLRDMQDQIRNSFMPLTELDMIIDYPWDPLLQKRIACKKWDQISMPDKQGDLRPYRDLQIVLRASNPVLTSTIQKQVALTPNVISSLGRIYNKTYDISYDTPLDSQGYPILGGGVTSGNTVTCINAGNYRAYPILQFTGQMNDIVLTNASNGQVVSFTQNVGEGDQIFYDIERARIFDAQGNNRSSMISTTSDPLQLDGTNSTSDGINVLSLSVSSFSNQAEFLVSWFDTCM